MSADEDKLFAAAVRMSERGVAILTKASEAIGPRIELVNDAFCALYDRAREEFIGEPVAASLSIIEQHQDIANDLLDHVFEDELFEGECTAQRRDGSQFELELQVMPMYEEGEIANWVLFVRDITALKQQMALLRRQAMFDPLTGLPNRAMLIDALDMALDNARAARRSVALLLMDLDHFKDVNDTFGHHHGDMLLKDVGDRLRGLTTSDDIVARLGGDEFALVLTSIPDVTRAVTMARRIVSAFEQPFTMDGQPVEANTSIGIAIYPDHGTDARTLMRRADVAMYAAKEANSGYAVHNSAHAERTPEELSLAAEVRRGIERDEFELYYQPKLHLGSGLMTRAEALIRWNHPRKGLLPPGVFIPLAERTGLIKPLTDWVLNRVMQQLHEWHATGAPVHVAVNVAAKSLREQTLPSKIQSLLDKWNIDPRFIKIEITETGVVHDPAHALAIMSMLQSMGLRLSLDDFGTGYSSLTHLRQLPVDEIKIDKSFVMAMEESEADMTIVRTIVDLGRNLGKQVCAEGVETAEAWRLLGEMNCDLAQGYWISKPIPAAALIEWLVDSFWGMKTVNA